MSAVSTIREAAELTRNWHRRVGGLQALSDASGQCDRPKPTKSFWPKDVKMSVTGRPLLLLLRLQRRRWVIRFYIEEGGQLAVIMEKRLAGATSMNVVSDVTQ